MRFHTMGSRCRKRSAADDSAPQTYRLRRGCERRARLKRLRKNSPLGRKAVPQGLKSSVFSITYGTTKVVP